ncbi:MAG: hypothetical protein ACKVWR_11035 [Acidimicrobiales bacterium]
MELVLLVVLGCLWVALLAPPILRSLGNRARADSVGTFRRQLSVLERTAPASPAARAGFRVARTQRHGFATLRGSESGPVRPAVAARRAAQRRRRRLLVGLLVAVPVTAVLAWFSSRWFVVLHLAVDAALVGFVTLLMRAQRIAAEREMKVAFLPHGNAGAEPTMLLSRSANG